ASSPAADTPVVERVDGLGRPISIDRYLAPRGQSGEFARVTYLYDELGRLAGTLDPAGHPKTQTFDFLGRVLTVDDPNAGVTRFAYDAAGNVIERSDARGQGVSMTYDGANRLTARWDPRDPEASRVEYTYDQGACSE